MSPARVEETNPLTPESQKRPASAEPVNEQDDESTVPPKRRKIDETNLVFEAAFPGEPKGASKLVSPDELAKKALRRSIALALEKVGFDASIPEAMESFVAMTESYLESLARDVKAFTNAARRSHPVPSDFELSLKRHNLTTSALQPHRKPPIPRSKRTPRWEPLDLEDSILGDLPILDSNLDGAPDKAARGYIPTSFPPFPSLHTYKCTPETVENVTSTSEDWDDLTTVDTQSQTLGVASQTQSQTQKPLAPEEIPRGDPKKMREAAAKEAKAGEAALRGLMRASKIAKQKEVYSAAQQEPARRERYNLWEAAMRELIEEDTKGKGKEVTTAAAIQKRIEIADHSMIVNAERRYYRREVPRTGIRKTAAGSEGVVGRG
ncbi:Bromodomain associated-domain-containing protein [Apodospora peruviana]|uniref:Transcription initiation factor TFIID subunit 8 n=1 Tax=Apodospora peruviana TaxID=516989 RepID=A0AAE0I276_9PEZI|nr:Bromodomain associated-domain-containing protein [Apodospora peruviana]